MLLQTATFVGQVLHSISEQRLDVINSMESHVERTVLPILKDVKDCWQPTDFLPDSSSPDFVDEARRPACCQVLDLTGSARSAAGPRMCHKCHRAAGG